MTCRGLTDTDECILLVAHQGERAAAFQVGTDMVEKPARGLPPNTLERLRLPSPRRRQVPTAQQPRQHRTGPRQLLTGQDRHTGIRTGASRQSGSLGGGGIVQHHHAAHLEFRCALRAPVLEEAAVRGDLVDGMGRHQTVGAYYPLGARMRQVCHCFSSTITSPRALGIE
ncbi:hypothetical protein AQJ66_36445, partial [Streptomyces bungoensis]